MNKKRHILPQKRTRMRHKKLSIKNNQKQTLSDHKQCHGLIYGNIVSLAVWGPMQKEWTTF